MDIYSEAYASLLSNKAGSYSSAPLPLSHRVRWGALYQPYTPAAYYFQAVVLVRRVRALLGLQHRASHAAAGARRVHRAAGRAVSDYAAACEALQK